MEVEHRNIKYPRIEYRTGMMKLILPVETEPTKLIQKYSKWISAKEKFIKTTSKEAKQLKIKEVPLDNFIRSIKKLVKDYSKELGVVVNRVQFRKLSSKWGS